MVTCSCDKVIEPWWLVEGKFLSYDLANGPGIPFPFGVSGAVGRLFRRRNRFRIRSFFRLPGHGYG